MAAMTYTIWVRTGDQTLGGTDSNIYIRLTGTQAQTDNIFLPPQDIFAFESGATDKFVLQVPNLGPLRQCCIGHDNSEGDSGWFVVDVRIRDNASGQEWTAVFNQWLGVEESGKLSACVDL